MDMMMHNTGARTSTKSGSSFTRLCITIAINVDVVVVVVVGVVVINTSTYTFRLPLRIDDHRARVL